MQRYRINHQLIIGLFVGSIALAVGLYFLWSWQVNRKAGVSRALAKKELEAGNIYEAYQNQLNFVRLRPDDMEAYAELGQIATKLMDDKDAPMEERIKAFGVLEESARRTGDSALRRELAKLYIQQSRATRASDGLDIVNELLEASPDDHELIEFKVQALYRSKDARRANELAAKVIGFNLIKKEFDTSKATVEDRPNIYSMLASAMLQNAKTREAANTIIDRMVETNPESAEAFLKKSIFLTLLNKKEEATQALAKARELDPTDEQVLFRIGTIALVEKDYDKAHEVFQDAIEVRPDIPKFHVYLGQVELSRKEYDQALETIEKALAKFEGINTKDLLLLRVDVYMQMKDYEGARRTAMELENLNLPNIKPIIDLVDARISVIEENWAQAAKELKQIRPRLIDYPQKQSQAGSLLGFCYEKLGMPDVAYQTYESVRLADPNNQMAVLGMNRLNKLLGRSDEPQQDTGFMGVVNAMLALPEDEQDWQEVDNTLSKIVEERGLSESRATLMRIEVFRLREKFVEANRLLKQLQEQNPEDKDVRLAEVAIAVKDPDQGAALALELLDKVVADYGSSFRTRMQKALLLLSLNLDDEELVKQLMDLTEGIDDLRLSEKLRIITTLATQLQQLGKLDEASQLWDKAIVLQPKNVPLYMQVFDIALRQQNNTAMKEAMDDILEVVQTEDDPRYVLTQAKKLLYNFISGEAKKADLEDVRKLIDSALEERPQWHELHNVYGKLLTALGVEPEEALKHFDLALEYGPPEPNALVVQIKLLQQIGNFESALEKMQLLPLAVRRRVLGNSEAVLLWKLGRQDEAYEAAEGLAEQQKNNVQIQAWFANLAGQIGRDEEALAALNRCVELEPTIPQYWLLLAGNYLKQKDIDSMHEVLNQAQLEVDAEFLPELAAKQYTYRGQFSSAEDIYLSMLERQEDKVRASRRMAEFYLVWGRVDSSKKSLANQYINNILRESNEGSLAKDHANAIWAREQAAMQLTQLGEYPDVVKAQKILESGAVDGNMSTADRLLMAEILYSQRDPKSQLRAMQIFRDLNKLNVLQKKHVLMFADILNRTNRLKECEDLLTSALPLFQNDSDLWTAYINMLIDNKNFSRAAARLKRLEDIDSESTILLNLRARLAEEQGDISKLRSVLKQLEPKSTAVLAEELEDVLLLARLSATHKDYETADKWYLFYAKRVPESIPEYTSFLCLHGDIEKAIVLIKRQFKESVDSALSNVIQLLRNRRSEVGDKHDELFEEMFAAALREDPDSVARLTMQAEFFEVQEKYEASIKAYDELLKRDDLSNRIRAACMNNLGFLLALKQVRLDDASQYIEEAMKSFGPVDDMLDTRAVVYMARDEYDRAVEDMVLATTATRDPIKYYHLAKAHLLAGNEQAAIEAWDQAKDFGFGPDKLPLLERPDSLEIEKKLENLRTTSANL